jgi:hypothetical protein
MAGGAGLMPEPDARLTRSPGIDTDLALRRASGNRELAASLLRIFAVENQDSTERIKALLQALEISRDLQALLRVGAELATPPWSVVYPLEPLDFIEARTRLRDVADLMARVRRL